jgi:four helix bundle protein
MGEMNYKEWEFSVPEEIRADSLWKMQAYRLALYLSELGWKDVTKLANDPRTNRLSDQLYRALGSISANLAEGYSRSGGKARALYFEYALGSARESRDWYYKGRFILGTDFVSQRIITLTQIIRLILTMLPDQRNRTIREDMVFYESFVDEET